MSLIQSPYKFKGKKAENKYVEHTNPGKYVSRDVQHLTNVTFLSTDGVLLANQLNPTLFYKAMFNKNVFNNNCLFFISK